MPAGSDAEVATLFRDLRVASNLTEADLAARIAAPVEVVQALEQGALYALPPWPETCRVVNAYGTMLNLDTGPLLRRIYAQLEAGIVELGPKAVPDVPVMAPPAPQAMPPAQAPTAPAQVPQAASPIPWPNGQPQAAPQPIASPPAAQPQAPSPQAAWPAAQPPLPQGGIGGAPQKAPFAPPPQAVPPLAPAPPEAPFSPQAPNAPDAAFSPEQPGQGFPDQPSEPLTGDDAAMGEPEDEPAPARKKSPLLKLGLVVVLILLMLVGIWTVFGDLSGSSSSSGSSSASDPVLGPDDPRSRKADRLPNNF